MRDKELTLEVLRQIEEAAAKILVRFQPVSQPSDFTDSPSTLPTCNPDLIVANST